MHMQYKTVYWEDCLEGKYDPLLMAKRKIGFSILIIDLK